MKISMDNPFNTFMTKVFDILLLNALFLLCCIPIITAGASASALYYMTMKMVKDEEGAIIRGFFSAFKENFRKSVPLTLLLILAVAVLLADLHILRGQNTSASMLIYGCCVTLLVAVAVVAGYVFPLLARFENTIKGTIVTAAKIAVTHLVQTLIITALNLLPVLWILISPETFAPVFILWIIVGPGAVAFVNSFLLVSIFAKFS